MRFSTAIILLAFLSSASAEQVGDDDRQLKRRDDLPPKAAAVDGRSGVSIRSGSCPAAQRSRFSSGRRPLPRMRSPGDPIYGQTTFPVIFASL